MNNTRAVAGSICLILALAGAAMGQSQPQRPAKADAPLSGPPVVKERPAHLEDRFSEGRTDKRDAMGDRSIRMASYVEIINKLRGDAAPAGLRLSEDQNKKITAIEQEFREATRAVAQRTRAGQPGQARPDTPRRPGAARPAEGRPPEGMTDEMQGQAPAQRRQRLEEARANAPKPQDYQVRIWSVLSSPQQKFVDKEVQVVLDEMEKRRGEEYMKRQLEKNQPGKPGVAAPPAPGQQARPGAAPGDGPAPEVRERVRRIFERLAQLPPEQRQRILQRLEEELNRMDGGGPAAPGRDRRGGPDAQPASKPAPGMDDVNVPAPERPRKP